MSASRQGCCTSMPGHTDSEKSQNYRYATVLQTQDQHVHSTHHKGPASDRASASTLPELASKSRDGSSARSDDIRSLIRDDFPEPRKRTTIRRSILFWGFALPFHLSRASLEEPAGALDLDFTALSGWAAFFKKESAMIVPCTWEQGHNI